MTSACPSASATSAPLRRRVDRVNALGKDAGRTARRKPADAALPGQDGDWCDVVDRLLASGPEMGRTQSCNGSGRGPGKQTAGSEGQGQWRRDRTGTAPAALTATIRQMLGRSPVPSRCFA
jgi:hypothetical protein